MNQAGAVNDIYERTTIASGTRMSISAPFLIRVLYVNLHTVLYIRVLVQYIRLEIGLFLTISYNMILLECVRFLSYRESESKFH